MIADDTPVGERIAQMCTGAAEMLARRGDRDIGSACYRPLHRET
ncbi:hypothetical protein [Mycobacterium sp. 050134]